MNLSAPYKIDISHELHPTPLQQMLISADKNANRLAFEIYDGETPFSPGGSCVGYVVRADGDTVPMTGTVSGNLLSIILPEEAYSVEGPVNVVVKSVAGGSRSTIFYGYGTILSGATGTIVNPGDVIPDITELMAAIDQMEQATAAANTAATKSVQYVVDQTSQFTAAQKAQARLNIQAAHYTDTAPLFSASTDYAAGDVVIYEGNLRRFTAAHPAGAWIGTDTAAVTISRLLGENAELIEKVLSLSSSDEYAQRLPANTDLDIVLTPGNYKITTDEDAATIQNRPDSVNMSFRLIVMATTQAGRCVQIVVPNSTANFLFIRRYDQYRSGWYTWNAVASRQYISDNAVLYTQDQSSALKDAQKGVARANIGAASETDLEIAQTTIGYAMTLSSSDTYGVTRLQGADLNTIVTIGAYKVTTDADAANTQNIPDGLSVPFKLYVMGLTQSGRYAQILVPSSKNNFLYIRQYDSYSTTPWGNWHAVADRKYIEDNAVLYTQDQSSTLTDAQKTMARNNIKAAMVSGTDSEGNSTGLLIQYN